MIYHFRVTSLWIQVRDLLSLYGFTFFSYGHMKLSPSALLEFMHLQWYTSFSLFHKFWLIRGCIDPTKQGFMQLFYHDERVLWKLVAWRPCKYIQLTYDCSWRVKDKQHKNLLQFLFIMEQSLLWMDSLKKDYIMPVLIKYIYCVILALSSPMLFNFSLVEWETFIPEKLYCRQCIAFFT